MISEIFIERPKLAMVISIVIMIGGILCITKVPVAEYPEVTPPQINVSATYPGASAQVIADTVAAPIETEVNGVENMIYFSSQSDNSGNYSLDLTFEPGTDQDIAMVNVQNAVNRAEPVLPEEVVALGLKVRKRSGDMLGVFVFTADEGTMSRLELSNYVARNVREPIARVPGVAQAYIFGELKYSMRIWLDPLKMSAMNISVDEVASAITSQNLQAAAGAVGTEFSHDKMQFKVNVVGRLSSVDEFKNIVVRSGDMARQVRIGDIARVELGSDSYSGSSYYNGKECIGMAIYRNNNANALNVINAVKAELKSLSHYFPPGVNYLMSYDPTSFIRAAMAEIIETLLITFVLVVLITYLFLQDWRATLIPTLAIPVALVGTFVFMVALGMSMNILTMFALILVIGSLVDDAIIVVENTMRLIEEEKLSPKEAAIKSMRQITGAIIATTLVTVAIYAPIGFYGGMVGTIYMQFSITICISLILSAVVALSLSPALCALILRPHQEPAAIFKPFNICLDFSKNIFLSCAAFLVRRILLTVVLFGAILALNYIIFDRTPTAFLPQEDKGAILAEIELPPGSSLIRTNKALLDAAGKFGKLDGVKAVFCVSGFSFMSGNGENVGILILTLDDWSKRKTPELSIDAIYAKAQAIGSQLPDARVDAFIPPAIMGLGVTGGVTFVLEDVQGRSAQELANVLYPFIAELNSLPDVQYAFSKFDVNTPQIELTLDRKKAEALGVPVKRVFAALQYNLASTPVNDFNIGGFTYKVKMQSDVKERRDIRNIEQLLVQSDNGGMVPLSSVATVKYISGPRQISRFTQYLNASVAVMGKPFVSSGSLMQQIQKLADEKLPEGYRIAWTDMSYQEAHNQGKIGALLALAFIFGYLFLVGQYESWTIPVPVILSVAVATLGGFIGLFIWNLPLSIYAQLGLVMLIGLASKNAILMVEFAKQEREAGVGIDEAAIGGGRARYRAVLMTAYSFVIGVFPMVIATGAGAGSRRAIGVTTFCGMVLATLVGIVFIPALYSICQRLREKGHAMFEKHK